MIQVINNNIKEVFDKTMNKPSPYIRTCFIRNVYKNNTADCEPIDHALFDIHEPVEAEYFKGVPFSPLNTKTTIIPEEEAYAWVMFIDRNNAIILAVSENKQNNIGNLQIISDANGVEISSKSLDTNEFMSKLEKANKFIQDLPMTDGTTFFDKTGYTFKDVAALRVWQRCGNVLNIDCDSYDIIMNNKTSFYLGKSGAIARDPLDCNVLKPTISGADERDIVNWFIVLRSTLYYENEDISFVKLFIIIANIEFYNRKIKVLSDNFLLYIRDLSDDYSIEESPTAFWLTKSKSILSDLFEYDSSNADKYYHSDYKKVIDLMIESATFDRIDYPFGIDYQEWFIKIILTFGEVGNLIYLVGIPHIYDTITNFFLDYDKDSHGGDMFGITGIIPVAKYTELLTTELSNLYNDLNYIVESNKCIEASRSEMIEDTTVTLRGLFDDTTALIESLEDDVNADMKELQTLLLSLSVTFTSKTVLSHTNFGNKLKKLREDIDFLLTDKAN